MYAFVGGSICFVSHVHRHEIIYRKLHWYYTHTSVSAHDTMIQFTSNGMVCVVELRRQSYFSSLTYEYHNYSCVCWVRSELQLNRVFFLLAKLKEKKRNKGIRFVIAILVSYCVKKMASPGITDNNSIIKKQNSIGKCCSQTMVWQHNSTAIWINILFLYTHRIKYATIFT